MTANPLVGSPCWKPFPCPPSHGAPHPARGCWRRTGGGWEGTFEAALTGLNSGRSVAMRFNEPPAAMQIGAAGPWSLGSNVEVEIVHHPTQQGPVPVTLSWQVDAEICCRIERRHSPYGMLEPLGSG